MSKVITRILKSESKTGGKARVTLCEDSFSVAGFDRKGTQPKDGSGL